MFVWRLSCRHCDKYVPTRMPGAFKIRGVFHVSWCVDGVSFCYTALRPFSYPATCPSSVQSALILIFMTKLRATTALLSHTPYSMFVWQDLHGLHVYCGWVILLDSLLHTVFHMSWWANQGNLLSLLFTHITGITGFLTILSCLLICVPMMVKQLRDVIKYKIRKYLHYLLWLFGLCMVFHAPTSALPNAGFCGYVFPILLGWYFLNNLYCYCFMTECIDTTQFHTLPSGVQVSMHVSPRFQSWGESGGYGYICLPWIDRTQWHAFSLFEHPEIPKK